MSELVDEVSCPFCVSDPMKFRCLLLHFRRHHHELGLETLDRATSHLDSRNWFRCATCHGPFLDQSTFDDHHAIGCANYIRIYELKASAEARRSKCNLGVG